ncbi:transporter, major facilitator family protein [Toxoplasma gondii VAND]|uniref:Molybdate-anion transporter n=1 Tax=Toxoplasma gondii VAND TaxID=933077 RepID=A0A086PUE8_TOXGO|nr:transporter, major facilitator family protein [Toxoplasma gondii VAND]
MIGTESCLLVFFLLAFLEAVLVSFRLGLSSPSSWFVSAVSSFFPSFLCFCPFASPGAPSLLPSPSDEGARVESSLSLSRQASWPLSSPSSVAASEERKAFLRLRRNYLLVYLLAQASEWIQGPYMFVFYSASCSLSLHHVGVLFLAEYASAGLFGCLVGCVADIFGHRRACLLYCLFCLLSCSFTRSSSSFTLLLLGRVVGGAALSVLETAFEAWVVTAHAALGFPPCWLEETLGACTLFNGILAIFVGFLSSAICKASGIPACFDLAAVLAVVAACSILALLPRVPGDREGLTKRQKSDKEEAPRKRDGGQGSDRAKKGHGEESEQADEEGKTTAEGKTDEGKGDVTDKEDVEAQEGRRGREEQRDGEQRDEEQRGPEVSSDAGETVPIPPSKEERRRRQDRKEGTEESGEEVCRSSSVTSQSAKPLFVSTCVGVEFNEEGGPPQGQWLPAFGAARDTDRERRRDKRSLAETSEAWKEESCSDGVCRAVGGHLLAALQVIFRNKAVQTCGAVQIFFEVPMYIFFVTWTPALDSRMDPGLVFACFMVCVVLGSEGFLQSGLRGRDPRLALRDALSVGAVALAVPSTVASHASRFAAFCVFEVQKRRKDGGERNHEAHRPKKPDRFASHLSTQTYTFEKRVPVCS